jgi:hypothetical protein
LRCDLVVSGDIVIVMLPAAKPGRTAVNYILAAPPTAAHCDYYVSYWDPLCAYTAAWTEPGTVRDMNGTGTVDAALLLRYNRPGPPDTS